jgi:rhamnosyltransferase subunit B
MLLSRIESIGALLVLNEPRKSMQPVARAHRPDARHTGRRIVLTTFGSLGDLYPYIAVALGLKARGHDVVIATTCRYRQRIEARGIGFSAVRPEGPDLEGGSEAMRLIMDQHKGPEYIVRKLVMPALQDSYADILAAARGADILVSHVLTYATRLVAEKLGIPWASAFLQPLGFFSAYDPPVLPQIPALQRLRFLGRHFHQALFWLARRSCRSWGAEWHALRNKNGLEFTADNPLFEGAYSPSLVLGMFSQSFAGKQADWPEQTVVSGFSFLDEPDGHQVSEELDRFLDAGPPPLVFTLGSSGVLGAGAFYQHSAAAAGQLGRRAILITGNVPANRPASLPDGVIALDYAPFSELFPRAAAIVHAGGVGTIGLAMRSGRPMLVMPCAHDQFDNAARVTRLGIARTISRKRYAPHRVAAELGQLLETPTYLQRASEIADGLRQEDGVAAACDALEQLLPQAVPSLRSERAEGREDLR